MNRYKYTTFIIWKIVNISFLNSLSELWVLCWNQNSRHPYLDSDLRGSFSPFSPLSMLAMDFSCAFATYKLFSILTLLSVFIILVFWNLSSALSASMEMTIWDFMLCSVNVVISPWWMLRILSWDGQSGSATRVGHKRATGIQNVLSQKS